MERFTLTVTVETDGNAEQLAALLTEFITDPGCPLMADYSADHPDRGVDGYDGPFVRFFGTRTTYSLRGSVA